MRKSKAVSWIDEHFEEALLAVLLVVIACVSLIQVVVRNVPFIPTLKWAEEFCRFAWIWSVFLSLPYTIKKGNMLRVAILLDLLPDRVGRLLNLSVDLIVAGVMGFLCWYSVPVIARIGSGAELSPAMAWPMWTVYIIIFVGFFLGTLRGIETFVYHLSHPEAGFTSKAQAEREADESTAAAQESGGR